MSEKRGYTAISKVATEVLELLEQGKIQRKVAEHFGFQSKYIVKDFVKHHNRKLKKIAAGIAPRPQGRQRKDAVPSDADKERDYEIKRLRMENELLRIFFTPLERSEAKYSI